MREKVGKSRFGAPEGPKVGSLKRRVRSQLARWDMKKCTPVWRKAHFQIKMYKTHQVRTTFGSWDAEKVHAVVARSTFPSQNVQNTSASEHFWKLRCRKSTRRCGAKHISKSKCTKHQHRTTFGSCDVEKVHAVVAWSTFPSQNVQNTSASDHFWKLRCRKSGRHCGRKHVSKSKCTKHQGFGPLLEVQMSKKCTSVRSTFWSQNVKSTRGSDHSWRFRCRFASLHYNTLHYTTVHYTTLHYITLHYTPQHYNYTTTLHYTPLHSTTLHYTTLHYTTLHYITLHITLRYTTATTTTTQLQSTTLKVHYTTVHYTTLHSTTLHYNYTYDYTTTLHYTPLHEITLQYTTLHYTTQHSTTLHYTIIHYTTLRYTEWHCTTDRQVDR